ncbi:RNA dependent RNA polymerase-domain-containing protein [Absidia repens]|uniref:RNA-dependent RNA polymerase n=1 Tax=Absidia repens TaxID=90262 RepID=A0A1X2J057_9FUNG|nr:RNA dependent RNA polymerase-domain-containing protein [Absidia repens]
MAYAPYFIPQELNPNFIPQGLNPNFIPQEFNPNFIPQGLPQYPSSGFSFLNNVPARPPVPPPMPKYKNNRKKVNKAIIVSNLKPTTKIRTIYEAFKKFGYLYNVELNKNEHDQPDGSAIVEFNSMPRHFDINQPLVIDDQTVAMKYGRILSEEERPTTCKAVSLTLGIMLTETEFVEEWSAYQGVKLVVYYERRRMNVEFLHLGVHYLMEIKFGDIDSNVVVENIGSATYLTLRLNQPPKLFKQRKTLFNETRIRLNKIPIIPAVPFDDIYSPDVTLDDESYDTCNTPTLVNATANNVRIETWTVLRMKFDPEQKNKHWLRKMLAGMADYNLVPRDSHLNAREQLKITSSAELPVPKNHQQRADLLDFDVLYHLECNISANYLMERNLDGKFYNLLTSLDASTARGILTVMAQKKTRVWNPVEAMNAIFKEHGKRVLHQCRIPPHCSMLRKVIITPTATYFQPLSLETTNRVVRHYAKYADRFIRVQFTDEDFMRLGPAFGISPNNVLYSRVYQTLKNGLQIGTRRYDYLGYSSSQLREQGSWFYAASDRESELPPLDGDVIRSWMGDFSNIKIVAKHAARIGQCFSSTMPIMQLRKNQVEYIDDIILNNYTFSDGVGNISRGLAKDVARRMSLRVIPSAFQFRLGGAKGMLVVSDKLKGRKVQLRPSQIKFESDHYMLEIVRTSSYIPAFLNRQAITVLSSLGVKNGAFMVKLDTVLYELNAMLENPENAIKILQVYPDSFGIASFMTRMINSGFLERQDPFLKNLLNMFRLRTLKNLKEKAKLPVDEGAFVFGVVDESGVLKEDEIFCQVTNDLERKERFVVKGRCIVYRNPCFHPGDIRVVNAVDHPELRERLVNVVAFPRVGERDIPSMCSGGDLDGDEFTIIWDKKLMPKIINHAPMDYTPSAPKTKANVTTDDIKEFFVDYIKSDNLGQIANTHLATADLSDDGAMDSGCLRLAQLHSLAVDFPKTGNPAIMERNLKLLRYPDFMCKEDKPSYVSKKVLGLMFRRINKMDYDEYESTLVDDPIYDTRLRVPGMERFIASARQSLEKYNLDLTALMNQYGVNTEAETISGFVMTWTNGCNKKSDFESQKQTASAVASMRRGWKKEFMREFKDAINKDKAKKAKHQKGINKRNNNNKGSSYSKEIELDLEAKAAAWYYVAYHPTERGRDHDTTKDGYFSFAWVMEDILIRVGKRHINQKQNDELAKAIDETLIRKYQAHGPTDDTQSTTNSNDDDGSFDDGDDGDSDYDNGDDNEDRNDDSDDNDGGNPKSNKAKDLLTHISDQKRNKMATGDDERDGASLVSKPELEFEPTEDDTPIVDVDASISELTIALTQQL